MKFRNTFQTFPLRMAGMIGVFGLSLSLGCAEKVEDAGPEKEELPNLKV